MNISVLVQTGDSYSLSTCLFPIKPAAPGLAVKLYSRDVGASVIYCSTSNSVPVLVGLTNQSGSVIPTLDIRLVVDDPLLCFNGGAALQRQLAPTENSQIRMGELIVSVAASSTFNSQIHYRPVVFLSS